LFNGAEILDGIAVDMSAFEADTLGVSDVPAKFSTKGFVDSALIADLELKLPGKVSSDSGSVADAGSLRGQGYAAFDYFAEDYVGYSLTF
jgi:hypothetical protein